jgi:hypothetical protein
VTRPAGRRVFAYDDALPSIFASLWRSGRVVTYGYDLFLSYAHADGLEYALSLWPELEKHGLTTCFDRTDFHIGERLHVTMHRSVAWSRALVLLDTPEARKSPEVAREIESAVSGQIPVLVIRKAGLAKSPWPYVDADDALIYKVESASRFDSGTPSTDAIEHLNRSHRARRVRTLFLRTVAATALLLAVLGTVVLLNYAFSSRMSAVFSQIHDPHVSIGAIDAAVAQTRSSWIWGRFGPAFRKAEMDLLASEVSRLQVKPIDWDLARVLERFGNIGPSSASPDETVSTLVVIPARGAVVRIEAGQVWMAQKDGARRCSGPPGRAQALAATGDGGWIAVATTAGIYLWKGDGCDTQPRALEPAWIPAAPLVALAFGNAGRSLLVADRERATIFECDSGACRAVATHTAIDATPPETAEPTAICRALISPTNELLVTTVGRCDSPSATQDICAFAEQRHCELNSSRLPVTFDPTGERVIALDRLTTWDVSELSPSRIRSPAMAERRWRFRDSYPTLGTVRALAFSADGGRLFVATSFVADEITFAVYRWPRPELLHAEPLAFVPTGLLADRFVIVYSPSQTFAADFRR